MTTASFSHDFKLVRFQVVLMVEPIGKDSMSLYRALPDEVVKIFDAEPFPMPPGAPPEFPFLVLNSQNQEWACNIAAERVDMIFQPGNGEVPENYYDQLVDLLMKFAKAPKLDLKIKRMAAVLLRYKPQEHASKHLVQRYCQEWMTKESPPEARGPLARPQHFELHAHKAYLLEPFYINSWIRNKSGATSPTADNALLVEQDLNIVEFLGQSYTLDRAQQFFDMMKPEFDKILALYHKEISP